MAYDRHIWEDVDKLVQGGESPRLVIPPTAKIVTHRKLGRPRTNDPSKPKGYNFVMRSPTGHPMKCRVVGCRRYLTKHQASLACSPACESLLKEEAQAILDVLSGKMDPQDFPPYFRTTRRISREARRSNKKAH